MLEIDLGGQPLLLMPHRTAYLPAWKLLLVADAHIGKAVSFRRLGVPVPGGTTAQTLQRLSSALAVSQAKGVVFLGDLLHSRHANEPSTVAQVAAWRRTHAGVDMTLVRGNHDRHAGDAPPDWQMRCVTGPLLLPVASDQAENSAQARGIEGPRTLALDHHPQETAGCYTLAGHLHPAVVLRGRTPGRLRLPCFHFGPQVGVLPAFGEFTGMHVMPRQPGDRVYAVAEDKVYAIAA
jgi:DNA ligase-associated metallophosphoesterase